MQSRLIKEVVRIINAIENEEEYVIKKYGHKKEFIDKGARNTFKIGKVTISIIKYAHRFNYYGLREAMINNNIVEATCPRYKKVET